MRRFRITPPSSRTQGETAYFLTTFLDRQSYLTAVRATCHAGEVCAELGDGLDAHALEYLLTHFRQEMRNGGTPDQIEEAEDLLMNWSDYTEEDPEP